MMLIKNGEILIAVAGHNGDYGDTLTAGAYYTPMANSLTYIFTDYQPDAQCDELKKILLGVLESYPKL